MAVHRTEIRVRYEETDRMGVAYYANYFVWFEVARTEHFRRLGFPYSELEKQGMRLMVVDAQCKYKLPVTYDDVISVETQIIAVKNTSLGFRYTVHRNASVIATGATTHVFTDGEGRPMRIPRHVKDVISALA